MKKLRFIGLLAAVVLLAFGLAVACSSGTTSDADDPVPISYSGTASGGKKVVVTFSDTVDAAKARAVLPANNSDYTITVDTVLASEGKAAVDSAGNITFRDKNGTEFSGKISGATITVSGIPNPAGGSPLSIGGTSSSGGGGGGGGFGSGGGGGGGGGGGMEPAVTDPDEIAAKIRGASDPDENGNIVVESKGTISASATVSGKIVIGTDEVVYNGSGDPVKKDVEINVTGEDTVFTITKASEDDGVTLSHNRSLVKTGEGKLVIDAPLLFVENETENEPPYFNTCDITVEEGTLEISSGAGNNVAIPQGSTVTIEDGGAITVKGTNLRFQGNLAVDGTVAGLDAIGGLQVNRGTLTLEDGAYLTIMHSTNADFINSELIVKNGVIELENYPGWADGHNGSPLLTFDGGSKLILGPEKGDVGVLYIHGRQALPASGDGDLGVPAVVITGGTVQIGGLGYGQLLVGGGDGDGVGLFELKGGAKAILGNAAGDGGDIIRQVSGVLKIDTDNNSKLTNVKDAGNTTPGAGYTTGTQNSVASIWTN